MKYHIFKFNKIHKAVTLFFITVYCIACIENDVQIYKTDILKDRVDSNSVSFFVLSDWGFSGSSGQREVAAEMSRISRSAGIDFIMTSGDNFQVAGVTSVNDPLWKENYENVYSDSALQVPWYPALGNHDYYGNPEAQVEYSAISKCWKMQARYYSFVEKVDSASAVRFVVLDTQGLINDYQQLDDTAKYDSIPEYAWLKKTLSESHEKWIIVTGHHPVFSASTFHGDTYEMNKLIKPLFDRYGVDFYVCGHDHDFEHAKDQHNYTEYIVTGTGGYVRPIGKNDRTVFALSELGFSYFIVTRDFIDLYFITATDRIPYSIRKKKTEPSLIKSAI